MKMYWALVLGTSNKVYTVSEGYSPFVGSDSKFIYTEDDCDELCKIKDEIPEPKFSEDWWTAKEQLIEYSNSIKAEFEKRKNEKNSNNNSLLHA